MRDREVGDAAPVGRATVGRALTARLQRTRDVKGFTLIELMIVMVIITVLAGIGIALYSNTVTRAKEAALRENLFQMRKAIDEYYADKNRWPADLQTLVSEKYIRKIPEDPMTNSPDTWQTEYGEADPGNPSSQPGISDVKSGSERSSPIDGTSYADW